MNQFKLPTKHQIELRAYELYGQRGRKEGHELDDWIAAEKELTEPSEQNSSNPQRAFAANAGTSREETLGDGARTPKARITKRDSSN